MKKHNDKEPEELSNAEQAENSEQREEPGNVPLDAWGDPIAETEPKETQWKPSKKKKTKLWMALALASVAVVGFIGGWFGHYYSLGQEVSTFLWGLEVAKQNYYKPLDEDELYKKLYDVLDLDPYSELFTPVEYDEYYSEGQGRYSGVGISVIDVKVGTDYVPQLALVYENSPANVAGLRKGMYVFGYGLGEELQTGTSSALREFISLTPDPVNLRCGLEKDGSDAKVYTVQRGSYQTAYVHYRDSETAFRFRYEKAGGFKNAKLTETFEPIEGLDEKTAYIRLDEFSGNAAEEFEAILSLMHERGRTDLILDLRTDGGGYMDILCEIASHLLRNAEKNRPVVAKAVFRNGREQNYNAEKNDFFDYFTEDSQVYILADENTASASECLIGAMVDYGTLDFSHIYLRENASGVAKSYGKGIMQSHFQNPNGSTMKLTTAEIVWPVSGKSIHGVGVVPEDGAIPVAADLIWGKTDPMLEKLIEDKLR